MIAEAILQITHSPILETKAKITLPPVSVSVKGIKMPTLQDTNNVYELTFDTFQLPEVVIPLDILHRVNHKTPQNLNILIFNTNNCFCSISRNSAIATLVLAGKCEKIQEVSLNQVQGNTEK